MSDAGRKKGHIKKYGSYSSLKFDKYFLSNTYLPSRGEGFGPRALQKNLYFQNLAHA
jgi:hypothetical protein